MWKHHPLLMLQPSVHCRCDSLPLFFGINESFIVHHGVSWRGLPWYYRSSVLYQEHTRVIGVTM
eukprot:COSAG01_NODE_28409_length_661_cov_5.183274_2_plen_64_part_00